MIDVTTAKRIATKFVNERSLRFRGELLVGDPVERPYGWVFSYGHRKLVVEGNRLYTLTNNGPVFVSRETGKIVEIDASVSISSFLADYEAKREFR